MNHLDPEEVGCRVSFALRFESAREIEGRPWILREPNGEEVRHFPLVIRRKLSFHPRKCRSVRYPQVPPTYGARVLEMNPPKRSLPCRTLGDVSTNTFDRPRRLRRNLY